MRFSVLALLLALACSPAFAQTYSGPIIDVHLHVGPAAPGAPNPATGQPTTANSDAEREQLTLERMRRHGIVLGLVSGPDTAMASILRAGGDDTIWAGAFLDDGRTPLAAGRSAAQGVRCRRAEGDGRDRRSVPRAGPQPMRGSSPTSRWPKSSTSPSASTPAWRRRARRMAAARASASTSATRCGWSRCSSVIPNCGCG